jgi:hypothetical protein
MTTAEKPGNPQASGAEAIASGIADVVTAALSVGAAVARTVAEATSPGGKSARPGAPGEGPVADIIHYSVETASNFARMVVSGLPSSMRTAQSGAAAPSTAPIFPTVHAGATLRVPLSIENPSDSEMSQMKFYCGELTHDARGTGSPLTTAAFVFQPAVLTIASRDFEKVTVFVTTGEDTAVGSYVAKIMVEGASFESALRFDVLPA